MFGARRSMTAMSRSKLSLEALEDRCLLSVTIVETSLVSDVPGLAQVTDPNLVNPWGIAASTSGPFWIADNQRGLSSLYNTRGTPQPLVVQVTMPDSVTGPCTPTGVVFNSAASAGDFQISDGSHSAPAVFLFATEYGTIAGWSPAADPSGKFDGPGHASAHTVVVVDYSTTGDTVYKGLTIATDDVGATLLYAANFRSGRIDVFDAKFNRVTDLPDNAFIDPRLPAGFAPFNVQALGDRIYVTYARQDAAKLDEISGPGQGFIDSFDLDGSHGRRLVSGGVLDAPWGLAIAPASFGDFAGDLLSGNFGNGRINVFDPKSGALRGTLSDSHGLPLVIDGLWSLKVGNGGKGGDADTVYFSAGLEYEQHGLFGSLTADSTTAHLAGPYSDSTDMGPQFITTTDQDRGEQPAAHGASEAPRSTKQDADALRAVAGAEEDLTLPSTATPSAGTFVGPLQAPISNSAAYSTKSYSPPSAYPSATLEIYPQGSYDHDTEGPSYSATVNRAPELGAALSFAQQSVLAGRPLLRSLDVPAGPSESYPESFVRAPATVSNAGLEPARHFDVTPSVVASLAADGADDKGLAGDEIHEPAKFQTVALITAQGTDDIASPFNFAGQSPPPAPPPQRGDLLGGALSLDLVRLRGTVDAFFARLESMAQSWTVYPEALKLVYWLLAGATAAGAFEFARRRSVSACGRAREAVDELLWAPFPVLSILPPEDKP